MPCIHTAQSGISWDFLWTLSSMGQEHAGRALQEVQVSRSAFLQVDNLSLKKNFPEYYLPVSPMVVLVVKNLPVNMADNRRGFDPWVMKIPWRRAQQPTPVFLPGGSHGQKSLDSYSPWGGRVEHDWLTEHTSISQPIKPFRKLPTVISSTPFTLSAASSLCMQTYIFLKASRSEFLRCIPTKLKVWIIYLHFLQPFSNLHLLKTVQALRMEKINVPNFTVCPVEGLIFYSTLVTVLFLLILQTKRITNRVRTP